MEKIVFYQRKNNFGNLEQVQTFMILSSEGKVCCCANFNTHKLHFEICSQYAHGTVGMDPETGHKDELEGWCTTPVKKDRGSWASSARGREDCSRRRHCGLLVLKWS